MNFALGLNLLTYMNPQNMSDNNPWLRVELMGQFSLLKLHLKESY